MIKRVWEIIRGKPNDVLADNSSGKHISQIMDSADSVESAALGLHTNPTLGELVYRSFHHRCAPEVVKFNQVQTQKDANNPILNDHSGGLGALMQIFSAACIYKGVLEGLSVPIPLSQNQLNTLTLLICEKWVAYNEYPRAATGEYLISKIAMFEALTMARNSWNELVAYSNVLSEPEASMFIPNDASVSLELMTTTIIEALDAYVKGLRK